MKIYKLTQLVDDWSERDWPLGYYTSLSLVEAAKKRFLGTWKDDLSPVFDVIEVQVNFDFWSETEDD